MKTAILLFVYGLQTYILIGLLAALFVQMIGLKKIDSSVDGAGIWFRIIIFPGMVALWPVLIYKWMTVDKGQSQN